MFSTFNLYSLFSVAVICAIGCNHIKAQPKADRRFVDLGVQITSTLIQGSTFTKYPDGRDVVCTVIRGEPAKLLVFDVNSGALLHRLPLEGADGAWNATTASDGSVYVGADDNGHLYRWVPGESEALDLGKVAPEQSFAWDVAAGDNGKVFIGTYPGCMVIRYHPDDGFKDVGGGAVAARENYVRGVAFDPAGAKVFAAVGAHAHLIEVDSKTGAKRNILPEKYKQHKFVYSVQVSGGKLFALITDGETLVMDLKSGAFESTLPKASQQLVVSPKSPRANRVYYNASGNLGWYDVGTRESGIAAEGVGAVNAMQWIGDSLAIFSKPGTLLMFDPATKSLARKKFDVPPEPTPIHYIQRGPDDRIYSGGYLSGGLAVFDPTTSKSQQVGSISQTEGITTLRDRLYLGCYPGARLYRYEPSKDWGPSNPHQIDALSRVDQDRPFAAIGVEKLNKIFFGTVPGYGMLGGALAVVDGDTDKVQVHRNIIADQSIVSLAECNGMIIGGTSIRGGLGLEPKATDARLFIWDPAAEKVIFETVPIKGARLITGLLMMPDKTVWCIADEKLIIFDPAKREVVKTKHLFKLREKRSGWRNAMMALHPSGQIYGTTYDQLFRLDPETLEVTPLRDVEMGMLALDREGRVYFRDKANLWQFTP